MLTGIRAGPRESLRGLSDQTIKIAVLYKMNAFHFLYTKHTINYTNFNISSPENFQKHVDVLEVNSYMCFKKENLCNPLA